MIEQQTLTLEEALRSYHQTLKENILRDEAEKEVYRKATNNLATGEAKRAYDKMSERQQIEWHKRDALRMVASMAGMELE